MLYRVFPLVPGAAPAEPGGPLHVPRERQGTGRHDHPESYGALYVSRVAESAIAERIQGFRGQTLTDGDLRLVDGTRYALASFNDEAIAQLVDLDDPAELARRQLRPSLVATRNRRVTREIALRIFNDGASGFAWWSTLESSWTNVTLFGERSIEHLILVREPEPLTVAHDALRAAAEAIGVGLIR
ncbi:MAG: RES family NAD+ phosphorylase [Chloroflexi bacterium]|nr:RES family NAD+ phosphorylase [Chloroflexota bacterium]